MKLIARFTTFGALAPLLFIANAAVAAPAETPAPKPEQSTTTLASRLHDLLGRAGGLTAADVAARAEATSFDVRAREEELLAAAAGVDQALVAYFPKLTLTGRYTRLSPIDAQSFGNLVTAPNAQAGQDLPAGSRLVAFPLAFPVLLNQTILQASLNVPLSDYVLRIPQAYAAASKSERSAALTNRAAHLKTAADARVSYYTWVRARLQQAVAEEALTQAKAHLTDARHAFEVGSLSRADVLRIESQVASSQLLLERASNLAALTETQLTIAMHDTNPSGYAIGESIDAETGPVEAATQNIKDLWAEAKARRLEARALDDSASSMREQAKVARAGQYPRLDAFADAAYSNPNARVFPQTNEFRATWDVGAQLTWTPNDIASQGAAGKNLDARAASLAAQRAALEDGIRIEVTQAHQALREAQEAILSSAQGLLSAEESYRVRRSLFQNGRATSVELTDAETDVTRARLEAINARVDLRVAKVRLEHATGRDVGTERLK